MQEQNILQRIRTSEMHKVKFAVTDIDGVLRGKYIHKSKFLNSYESELGFCDVVLGWDANDKCYDNTELTGWHTGYPDAKIKIDVSTFREIPWENSQSFFLADFSADKKYNQICPRSLLKTIVKDFIDEGFLPMVGFEYEWFNFEGTPNEISRNNFNNLQTISPGMFGYSILRSTLNNPFFSALFSNMEKFDVSLEGLHTETGPGVLEAAINFDKALIAADKAVLFKSGTKEIAYKNNMIASFMAKWNTDLPGCGGHIHQSLWNTGKTENLFFNPDKENRMSETMEHFIAGQLYCLPEILPMYAPTVNSYKRIGHGDWAPGTVTWGIDNRTASVRAITTSKKSARVEMRVPGADANPYLALAASLASGLYGIKNKLALEDATVGNAYKRKKRELSKNLLSATKKMEKSDLAKSLFGESFVGHFTKTRYWEWQQFENYVTDWELKRYFEII